MTDPASGERTARVFVGVEIEAPDGTIHRYEAMGEPTPGGRSIALTPQVDRLGVPERVYVGLELTLMPIDGEALYTVTEIAPPARAIGGGVVVLDS